MAEARKRAGARRGWLTIPATLGLLLAFASTAGAEEVVNDNTDGPGACGTPAHATVQAGVNAASADETVTVCPGTYAETVTIPNGSDGLTIDGAQGQPTITGGIGYGSPTTDLTLRDLHVEPGAGSSVIGFTGSVTNLTMENVMVDGNQVVGKHGVASGQIHGAVEVHGSQFVDIRNWAVFDTRSGSGGATQGSDLSTFDFSGNVLSNNIGHVAARGTIGDETSSVTIANNVVENYPDAPTILSASAFKVFYADELDFTGNEISNVGTLQADIGGFPYGSGLMPRNVGDLNVTGNTFAGSVQGIAFEPRNTTSGGFPDGVIAGGTIAGNEFEGNDQGIFVTATNNPASDLGALEIHGNRFVGNGQAIDNNTAAGFDAENNWWGCNAGPGSSGCDASGGSVDSDPRLVLGVSADPGTVEVGGSSQVSASLGRNSAGQAIATNAVDGDQVAFATTLGSVQSPGTFAGATATTTLSSGASPGTAEVTATFDSQTVGTQVTIAPAAEPEEAPPPAAPLPSDLDEVITGTAGADTIDGGGGADTIFGGAGDDILIGAAGGDTVDGGEGDDTLAGGGGADILSGGEGADEVHGGLGQDELDGGSGDDGLASGAGQDDIDATDGEADEVSCGRNVDTVDADPEDDVAKNCETVT